MLTQGDSFVYLEGALCGDGHKGDREREGGRETETETDRGRQRQRDSERERYGEEHRP